MPPSDPAATAPAAPPPSGRRWEVDALRGLMLVLITTTHMPTRFADPLGQPFGFVSAAEGFVLLSGYMAGQVYTARLRNDAEALSRAFVQRALKLYLFQAALLVFAFTVIALLGIGLREPAVKDLVSFYFERPFVAFFAGLALLYNPPLLDILPMYVLLMVLSPPLLLHGLRHGWALGLAGSVALWVAAQFGVGGWLYEEVASAIALPVPLRQTGAFELFAWQFVWGLGLWMGATAALDPAARTTFPRWMVRVAWVVFLVCFVWRHAVGNDPWPGNPLVNAWFDKWRLGPLRLIDLFALMVLAMHYSEWLKTHLPRVPAIELMGRVSLPVFCTHLVVALSAIALVGNYKPGRPLVVDLAVLAAAYGLMYLTAWIVDLLDRRTALLRKRRRERREAKRLRKLQAKAGAKAGREVSAGGRR